MAEITFTGFVDEWTKDTPQHPNWGMRVSEPHRKKDGDKWVTVARTRRTVKAAFDVDIDFTQFATGSRVFIEGTEVTEVSERNGVKYENLIVKATTVELITTTGAPAAQGSGFTVTDETPF